MELSWWSRSDRGLRHRGSLLCAALVERCGPASLRCGQVCCCAAAVLGAREMIMLLRQRVLRQKADPGHNVCNVDIGIQQLRYWLPLGAELSGGHNCPLLALHTSPLPGKLQQNAQRSQEWLTSGCPWPAAAGLLRPKEHHRWTRSSCQTWAAGEWRAWWVRTFRYCWR